MVRSIFDTNGIPYQSDEPLNSSLRSQSRKLITVKPHGKHLQEVTVWGKLEKPLLATRLLIYFEFRSKPSLITVIWMDPHSPKKFIATKYCFFILGDDTGFFFFLSLFLYFSFLCYVMLCYLFCYFKFLQKLFSIYCSFYYYYLLLLFLLIFLFI